MVQRGKPSHDLDLDSQWRRSSVECNRTAVRTQIAVLTRSLAHCAIEFDSLDRSGRAGSYVYLKGTHRKSTRATKAPLAAG